LEDAITTEARPWRLGATMFSLLGLLAIVIAAFGTYSVTHYAVAQRRQEMGVRVALGAQRLDILRLVFGQSLSVGLARALLDSASSWPPHHSEE